MLTHESILDRRFDGKGRRLVTFMSVLRLVRLKSGVAKHQPFGAVNSRLAGKTSMSSFKGTWHKAAAVLIFCCLLQAPTCCCKSFAASTHQPLRDPRQETRI